jgi:hypothetical protein
MAGDATIKPVMGTCMLCGTEVEIPAFVVELGLRFSAELRRRGQPPLGAHDLMRCPPCQARWRKV